jgi:hypothetical protein
MLLLCFGICVALGIVFVIFWSCGSNWKKSNFHNWCDDHSEGLGATAILSFILAGVLLLSIVFVGGSYSQVISIDEKIAMYQEENAQIETEIDEIVAAYLSHEQTVMENAKPPESVTAILLTYPELNSNTMVTKQIEIYADNNNQIKALKAEKLNLQVLRWWLFF